MIQWAFTLFIATLVATPFAFGDVRPEVATIAQLFFALFFALFALTAGVVLHRWRRGRS
jgi:uncharacterized membrane protein YtjA (UPF0391 family)